MGKNQQEKAPDNSIALCMIVRDEEDRLSLCLNSVKGLVSGTYIVDTGSKDGTIQIARAFGAEVRSIPWNNDFSAPRNVSLEMARAEWALVLDADEALAADSIPLIRAAVKREGVVGWTLPTRNYTHDSASANFIPNDGSYQPAAAFPGWVESRKIRLFRNLPGIRFEGRLHELVEPSIRRIGGGADFLDAPVHHFGYVGPQEVVKAKLLRMKSLAEAKCAESPDDYKSFYELGVIQVRLGLLEDAKSSLQAAIARRQRFALAHYDLGVVLSRRGELTQAAEEFQTAIQLEPLNRDALYNLAVTLQKLKRISEAEAAYQRVLQVNPDEKRAWNNLGALFASEGRFSEAKTAFQKTLNVDPDFADAVINLNKLKAAAGPAEIPLDPVAPKEAPTLSLLMIVRNERENLQQSLSNIVSHFDEVVIADTGSNDGTPEVAAKFGCKVFSFPWNDDFSAARNFALGEVQSDWVLWLDADDQIDPAHINILKKHLKEKDKAFFIRVASGAAGAEFLQLRLFPRLEGIRWEGRAHEQILPSLKQQGVQVEALPGALIVHRGYDDPKLAKRKAHRNIRLLEQELRQRPGDANVLHHLGQAYGMVGRLQDAVDAFERLAKSQENGPVDEFLLHALNMLVQNHLLLGHPNDAVHWAQRVLELDPENRLVKYFLGEISYRGGRFAESIEWLQRFCAAMPTHGLIAIPWKALSANAHNYLGLAYSKLRNLKEARAEFEKGIENGGRIEIYKNLASLHLREKDYEQAAKIYCAAAQKERSDPNLWVNYGIALALSKDEPRAVEAFQEALSLDPAHRAAKHNLSLLQHKMDAPRFKKAFTLSACIIAKNEEKSIRRAIESIKPISNEIIVVDSGSTDATAEIARDCGAKVLKVNWTDDFAAARNASLAAANGEWILIIDADEVIAVSDLAAIASLAPLPDVFGYSLVTRNYSSDRRIIGWQAAAPSDKYSLGQPGWFPSTKVRLFRNAPEVRFEGRIHECVEPSILRAGKRVESLDVPVHHYGYIEGREQKQKQYLSLARRKAEENPQNARAHYELGIQHLDLGQLPQAETALEHALEIDRRNELTLLNLAIVKIQLEKLPEAEALLSEAVALNSSSACAHYNLGVVLEKLGRLEDAEKTYREAVSLDPRDANAPAKLGYIKATHGKWEEAARLLRQASSIDPGHQIAKRNLDYVESKIKDRPATQRELSLNMIVKNEEQNLREGLAPIAKLFDETVIVDTGSTDATAEVAESLGAKVIRQPWNNNFAEARNTALKQSSGKWIFWLDADDRIEPGAVRTLRKFIRRDVPCGVFFPLESKIGETGALVKNYTLRLFPNSPGISWQGTVHEQIAQSLRSSGIKLVNCPDFTIRHIGYEKDGAVIRKNLRNLKLLSLELATRPEDPYVLFALAQAFLFCGQTQAAARWLRELWRLREKVAADSWKEVFWLAAIVLSDCAEVSSVSREANEWLNQALALAPENWLAYFLLAERKIKSNDFESASALLHRVEELGITPTILPLDLDSIAHRFQQYLAMLNEKASPALS